MANHQHICTECGDPFASVNSSAKTCSPKCRKRRSERFKRDPNASEFAIEAGPAQAAMQAGVDAAVEDIGNIAREVVKEEVRPAVREALSVDVLNSIAGILELVPLATEALRDELQAAVFQYDDDGNRLTDEEGRPVCVADHEARHRAASLVYKYTVGQPGLAPQPEAEERSPITIVFPEGMTGVVHVDGQAEEDMEALLPGQKHCDICHQPKDEDEFVAGSDRCQECHDAQNARVHARLAELTAPKSGD